MSRQTPFLGFAAASYEVDLDMAQFKGRIGTEKSVTCARCECYLPGLKKEAAKELREDYGWNLKRGIGWLCPQCSAHTASSHQRRWVIGYGQG